MLDRETVERLPTVPLAAWALPAEVRGVDGPEGTPDVLGYGPAGGWAALWHLPGEAGALVRWQSWTDARVHERVLRVVLQRVYFAQPLSGGRVLLASNRRGRSDSSAQIWDARGGLIAEGDLGDALEHVLVTESDVIWVGYFDEALTGREPEGHGLVEFAVDLQPTWLYPWNTSLPDLSDCENLNVVGESVFLCPYWSHQLVEVSEDTIVDYGIAPARGARALLVDGHRMALIGGYESEYDLITPFVIDRGQLLPVGSQGRLAVPEGENPIHFRWSCRGAVGYADSAAGHYQLSVNDVFAALVDPRPPEDRSRRLNSAWRRREVRRRRDGSTGRGRC